MGTPGRGGGGGLLFRGGTSFPLSFWFTLEMFFLWGAPGGHREFVGGHVPSAGL